MLKDKEAYKTYHREYYQTHKEEIKAKREAWSPEKKAAIAEYQKEWRKRPGAKEKLRKYEKNYLSTPEHRDKVREKNKRAQRRYRAKTKGLYCRMCKYFVSCDRDINGAILYACDNEKSKRYMILAETKDRGCIHFVKKEEAEK